MISTKIKDEVFKLQLTCYLHYDKGSLFILFSIYRRQLFYSYYNLVLKNKNFILK
jgi:hypothetical protein